VDVWPRDAAGCATLPAMSKFAVLGPGAVGGFLAGALNYRSTQVTIVADEHTSSRLRTHGLHVVSATVGDFTTRPRAIDTLEEPVDVLFITTKTYELQAAVERIKTPPHLIIPLLSGLENVGYLRSRFPDTLVCAASIRIEAEKKDVAEISHTSSFAVIDAGFDDDWLNHRELKPLVDPLGAGGIAFMVSSSEVQVLWSKLVFLNALSLTSALSNMPVGWIRKEPAWRTRLQSALEEGASVAQADGARISVEMTMDYVDHANYQLGSVMQRDLLAGKPLELDGIAGAVLRAGARHGLQLPTIRSLAAEVAAKASMPAPAI